jgi:hypothetical protein
MPWRWRHNVPLKLRQNRNDSHLPTPRRKNLILRFLQPFLRSYTRTDRQTPRLLRKFTNFCFTGFTYHSVQPHLPRFALCSWERSKTNESSWGHIFPQFSDNHNRPWRTLHPAELPHLNWIWNEKKYTLCYAHLFLNQMHFLSQNAIVRSSVLNLNSNEFKGKSHS